MFTGIIEELGQLRRMGGGSIEIGCRLVLEDAHVGDSIAVNGICLTVTRLGDGFFAADVMPETLRRTSLDGLGQGSPVNLERALLPTSRMGGHIVSGHIDGTGTVAGIGREGNAVLLEVAAAPGLLRYIVEKGSVALDGISLTVASVAPGSFSVSLIPHTRETTNLRDKRRGSPVNIETDIIGKYVERLLRQGDEAAPGSGLDCSFLEANGFMGASMFHSKI